MKTSSKSRYAIYLMTDITRNERNGPVPLREVSIRQGISLKYLEQIAGTLGKLGYLKSVRGAQGGYRLSRAPEDISAGDIMRAIEGELVTVTCLEDTAEECPRQSTSCNIAAFWQGLSDSIYAYTDKVSLKELAAEQLAAG